MLHGDIDGVLKREGLCPGAGSSTSARLYLAVTPELCKTPLQHHPSPPPTPLFPPSSQPLRVKRLLSTRPEEPGGTGKQ